MQRTGRPSTSRSPEEMSWGNIQTENAYDLDGTIPQNQGISLANFDLFQGYMKTRKTVQYMENSPTSPEFTGDLLSQVTWVTEGEEFIVLQYALGYWYKNINDGAEPWRQLRDINFHTGAVGSFVPSNDVPCRFVKAADKIYVFHELGNIVLEWNPDIVGTLRARPVGMGRPAITGSTDVAVPATLLEAGTYGYAVEYVYRKSIGTSAEADFLASTPQRRTLLDTRVVYFTKDIPAGQGIEVEFNTVDAQADELWTHAKLYRTKKLNQDDVLDELYGSPDELYLIKRIERSTLGAVGPWSFSVDEFNDNELPVVSLGAETVIYPDLDQEVLPDANIGVFHQNKLWVTDIPDDIMGKTDLVYTSPTSFKYSEQYSPLFRYPCNNGDGQDITDLVALEEDLIVFKQAQTGRVPNGNPDVPYDKMDDSIGIAGRAFFVPKIGIVGLVNDQSDVMVFGYNLQWNTTLRGIPFSRPVRGVFKAVAPNYPGQPLNELTGATYFEGKLLLSVGYDIWAFHVSENLGWSHYEMGPYFGQEVSMIITNTLQDRCFFAFRNEDQIFEFGDREIAEYNSEFLSSEVQTSGFQVDGGRGFVEQRYISLMGVLTQAATMSVAYTSRDNEIKDSEPFALTPGDVNPDNLKVLAEYQYYAKASYPERTRIYADRLFYTIKFTGYAEVRDVKLYAYLQTGMRTPTGSTKNTQDNNNGIIADLSSGLLHWQTRDDMSKDRENPNDSSKPFQEISFIVMRAP